MTAVDHALRYAAVGMAVFAVHGMTARGCTCGRDPCKDAGKHPTTEHGLKEASKDASVVRAMWRRNAAFNVAVCAGSISGFWVLDLDGPDAEAAMAAHQAEHGALPATVEQSTGRGRHLCFAWDAAFPVRNMSRRSRALIGPDIDVRGDGGYIIVAPSRHKSGRIYTWAPGASPFEREFAKAPEWLMRLVSPPPEPEPERLAPQPRRYQAGRASAYGEAALDNAVREIAAARVGIRDTTLYRASCNIGCLVAGGHIELSYARDALIGAGGVHVPDAMSEAQLVRQVDRALAWGDGHPRIVPDRATTPRPREASPRSAAARTEIGRASATFGVNELSALWDNARPAWVKPVTAWLTARGLKPGALPDALASMRAHPSAPWGRGSYGPALLAQMIREPGEDLAALAILPLHADCEHFSQLLGDTTGRVIALTRLDAAFSPDVLVALDLQDAWRLASDLGRPIRTVVASMRGFAGGALGDRYGRIDPDAPAADPASPPWRLGGADRVFLAVRRDLRPPRMRARAFGGGSRDVELRGDAAARFFGGLAEQAWRRADDGFQPANAVRLLAPPGDGGFNDQIMRYVDGGR